MLPAWAGWTSFVLMFVFGGLNVFQFVKSLLEESRRNSAKAQLEQIRVMCTVAIDKGEALSTESSRQFVESIMHQIRGIERGLGFDEKDVGTRRG